MFKFYIYKLGQFLVNSLPLSVGYKLGIFLSDLQYYFSSKDRQSVTNNLKIILPNGSDVSIKAREVFRNFGRYLVEFFRMDSEFYRDYISKKIQLKNLDALKDAISKGKGGIILTAHVGNWELGAAVLSSLGYPITAIALPHKERSVNNFFNNKRENMGVKVVPTNLAIRRCIEALKQNELIAVVADRDFSANGEILNFLGKKAIIPKGAAIFSCRTGAPIIPTFLLRNPDNSFTLSFRDPILPPKQSKKDNLEKSVLVKVMRQYTSIIEDVIRDNPTQWLMFREFWVK